MLDTQNSLYGPQCTRDHTTISQGAFGNQCQLACALNRQRNSAIKGPNRASLGRHECIEWSSLSVKIVDLNRIWNEWKETRVDPLSTPFLLFLQLFHSALTLNHHLLHPVLLASGWGGLWSSREKLREGARGGSDQSCQGRHPAIGRDCAFQATMRGQMRLVLCSVIWYLHHPQKTQLFIL